MHNVVVVRAMRLYPAFPGYLGTNMFGCNAGKSFQIKGESSDTRPAVPIGR